MSRKKAPAKETQGTVISCTAPEARSVLIAGSFNDWNAESHPLARTRDGTWSIALPLSPGRYEFKFIVDGVWCCKPGCDDHQHRECAQCVPNEHGTMNRVLEVR